MSVTQDYKFWSAIQSLEELRTQLLDARVEARRAGDWKADDEITCALRGIGSALIALGQVK